MVAHLPLPIKAAGLPDAYAVARFRSSDGCDGRLADGKLSATATAAMPMAKEPT
jgi:hypothetical protein